MGRGGILQRMRAGGLLLALFALTFKAFLPPGFMLSPASDHTIQVTLCGGAAAELDLRANQSAHPDGHNSDRSQDASQHCPFALAGALTLAPPATRIDFRAQPILFAALPAQIQYAPWNLARPPLPARGPPLHA